MDRLVKSRNRIDEIDDAIMQLLDERYDLSMEIGEIKKKQKTQVLDANREQIILDKTSKLRHSHSIKNVYHTIMDESKKLQRK